MSPLSVVARRETGRPTLRAIACIASLRASGQRSRREVWTTATTHGLLGVVPCLVTLGVWGIAASHHMFAVDFNHAFWPAGHRVLAGLSPYAAPDSLAARTGVAFVYPAPGALLFAAFAWLPHGTANVVFTLVTLAAALGACAAAGVRDWRIYGIVLLWPSVIAGWQTANLSLLLAFGVACAWRARERPVAAGVIVGVVVSLKVFLWPLALWLAGTRRWRALAWAIIATAVVNLVSWAVIGYTEVDAYMRLARVVAGLEQRIGYTPYALVLKFGAGRMLAWTMALALAGGAAGWCLRAALWGRDAAALTAAITLALLATPVVWSHYFALLLVPLAVARPRFCWAWAIPLGLVVCPVTGPSLVQLCIALGAVGVLLAILARSGPGPAALRPIPATLPG